MADSESAGHFSFVCLLQITSLFCLFSIPSGAMDPCDIEDTDISMLVWHSRPRLCEFNTICSYHYYPRSSALIHGTFPICVIRANQW
jgi:hypothetical protein